MKLALNIKEHIKSHALTDQPHECCGLLVSTKEAMLAVKCKNQSESPLHAFSIGPFDYIKASNKGNIEAVYHSHNAIEDFSETDKINSSSHQLKFIIYNIAHDSFSSFDPVAEKITYINKPFKIGVNDCYTLVRDYYKEKLNIPFPEGIENAYQQKSQREDMDGAIKAINAESLSTHCRLEKVYIKNKEDLKENDIIVLSFKGSQEPCHMGIYLKGEMFMHHPRNKHAITEKINNSFLKRIIYIYRYK